MFAYFATAIAIAVAAAIFVSACPEMFSAFLDRCFYSLDIAGSVHMFYLHPSQYYAHNTTTAAVELLSILIFFAVVAISFFWAGKKLLQLALRMIGASFEDANASFMIPSPPESDPLANLIAIYQSSKRDRPQRFKSGSRYEKKLAECKVHKKGIDMLFLEMELRMEFRPTPLSNLVRNTWEETAFDKVYDEWMEELDASWEKMGVEEERDMPAKDIVVPTGVLEETEEELMGEEEIIFDHLVVEREEEEELIEEVPAVEAEEESVVESVVEDVSTAETEEVEEEEVGNGAPVEDEAMKRKRNDFEQLFDQIFSGLTEKVEEADRKDAHAVVPRVHWSDRDFAHRRYRPHSESGHTISSEVYFKCSVQRKRLEEHVRHYGCVLDQLSGLTSVRYFDTEAEAAEEDSVEQQDINFDHEVVEQEEEKYPPQRKHKRSKGRRELASLECGLGKYWSSPTSEQRGRVRRSGRKRRAPVRYSP